MLPSGRSDSPGNIARTNDACFNEYAPAKRSMRESASGSGRGGSTESWGRVLYVQIFAMIEDFSVRTRFLFPKGSRGNWGAVAKIDACDGHHLT